MKSYNLINPEQAHQAIAKIWLEVKNNLMDFGKHFGYDADFAYDILMYKFNPVFKYDIEGNELRLPGSFSKLNISDAAIVQDNMLRYGIDNGFYWDESV